MWNLVFGSVRGTSHERTGKPCQDYCEGRTVATPSGTVLLAVCADGAGSSDHSDVGARIACETIVEDACAALSQGTGAAVPGREVLLDWNLRAREQIQL